MSATRYVFWHHAPNMHHAPYLKALAEKLGEGAVHCVFADQKTPNRDAMGWNTPALGELVTTWTIKDDWKTVNKFTGENTYHIFNSILPNLNIRRCFQQILKEQNNVFLTSELRDWRGLKGAARSIHSFWQERLWQSRLKGVFAMGELGECWFQRCGYPPDKIFPFCYVVEDLPPPLRRINDPGRGARIIFVGNLVKRKRVELLLQALHSLTELDWTLEVIGPGPEQSNLAAVSHGYGFDDRVRFSGVLSNDQVRVRIEKADVLILPSYLDGWGAVVNEALMVGTHVICSDACGAADLLRSPGLGTVFPCDEVSALAVSIRGFIVNLEGYRALRPKVRSWAYCISGESIAGYIINCTHWSAKKQGLKPIAPWRAEVPPNRTLT